MLPVNLPDYYLTLCSLMELCTLNQASNTQYDIEMAQSQLAHLPMVNTQHHLPTDNVLRVEYTSRCDCCRRRTSF